MAQPAPNLQPPSPGMASMDTPTQRRRSQRPRRPSVPRPVYFIIQILDESGQPTAFDKNRIKIVSVERNSDKVLEITGGDTPHVFYLRGMVPAGRGGGAPVAAAQPQAV